jgi:serine/threonine protein kinase/WD40 repeat protein
MEDNKDDQRITELLLIWEESLLAGTPVDLVTLCGGDTELISRLKREIEILQKVDHFLDTPYEIDTPHDHGNRFTGLTSALPEHPFRNRRDLIVPGFELLEELGRGGMGVVYKARQESLDRFVAIKMLNGNRWSHPGFLTRLRNEAKALGKLNHPNIVQVIDIVETADSLSIVLEYVPGDNLLKQMNGQAIPPNEAARIAFTLAQTLTTVHEKGLLHRDLKPANVLIGPSRLVKIADFGMAKDVDAGSTQTATGDQQGTPGYMAPEQASGHKAEIGIRTDVYGIGATFYEMLTGRPPFVGSSHLETLNQVLNRDPIRLGFLNPETPCDLETICLKCLEKNPQNRFSSARELADELDRYLQGKPILTRPIAPIHRLWRWCRREPALTGLISVLLVAAPTIAWLVFATQAAKQRDLVNHNLELEELNQKLVVSYARATELQLIAEKAAKEAREIAYASDIGRVAAAWRQGDSRTMVEILDRHIPKEGEEDARGFEWWYLKGQVTVPGRQLLDTGAAIYVIRQTGDGRWMVASGADSTVRFFNPETGEIWKELHTGQGEINGTAFKFQSSVIATAGDDGTVRVLNYLTGEEVLKVNTPLPKVYGIRFTADGTLLIACGTSPDISVFDAQTSELLFRLEGHTKTVQNIEIWDETLVSNSNDGTIRFWDLRTREAVKEISTPYSFGPMAVNVSAKLLAVGTTTGPIFMVDLQSKEITSSIWVPEAIGGLAFDPSGSRLAIGDVSGRICVRNVNSLGLIANEDLMAWQAHRAAVGPLRWRASKDELISGGRDGRVTAWNGAVIDRRQRILVTPQSAFEPFSSRPQKVVLRTDELQRDYEHVRLPPRTPGRLYGQFAFSSDGNYFAAVTENGKLQLFSVSGQPAAFIDEHRSAEFDSPGLIGIVGFISNSSQLAIVESRTDPATELLISSQISVLRLPSLELINRVPVDKVKYSSVSTDGRRISFADAEAVYLWDAEKECLLWRAPQTKVLMTAISDDGTNVAVSGFNNAIIIRNSHDGSVKTRFSNERTKSSKVIFSPDGRTLISVMHSTLRFLHVATGQDLLELSLPGGIHRIEFSPDGKRLFCQYTKIIGGLSLVDEIEVFDAHKVVNH